MPGIVGFVTKMPRSLAEVQLRRMISTILRTPSDIARTWSDDSLGIYVGWAERKGETSQRSRLLQGGSGTTLILSGEEFGNTGADGLERADLLDTADRGEAFPSNFLRTLNGWFHGLLVDRVRGRSFLFNDRYGLNRIYFHECEDAFYFAAEAKAILAVRPGLREIDQRSLGEFITCGCVLENRSLFRGIQVLPPASAWELSSRFTPERRAYFQPSEWEQQKPLSPKDYYENLRDVYREALPRYFKGEDRIAISLTGGLDTRMVMAWHELFPRDTQTYSFGGMYRDSQDVLLARRLATACGLRHEVITVGNEFLSNFPDYAERSVYLTDGCLAVNHSPDLFANERAAQIAPVRLTGNYGSEVLRSTRAFKPVQPTPGLFTQELLAHFERATETYTGISNGHPLSFSAFKQAPWHHYGLLALEQSQLKLRSPFLDNQLVQAVFRAPIASLKNADISLRLIAEGDRSLLSIPTDRGLAGTRTGFSAAATRSFLEFTAKAEYAYDYGMPHRLAQVDRFLKPFHPERLFLGRHKFYHFRIWYRDVLADYLRDVLLSPKSLSRAYLEPGKLKALISEHRSGKFNHTQAIHSVLTLELIHRLFIDKEQAPANDPIHALGNSTTRIQP